MTRTSNPSVDPTFQLDFSVGFGRTLGSREHEREKVDFITILKLYQKVLIFCHSIYYLDKHNIFLLVFKIYTQINMKGQILSWSKSTDSHPSQASQADLYQQSILLKLLRQQRNHKAL